MGDEGYCSNVVKHTSKPEVEYTNHFPHMFDTQTSKPLSRARRKLLSVLLISSANFDVSTHSHTFKKIGRDILSGGGVVFPTKLQNFSFYISCLPTYQVDIAFCKLCLPVTHLFSSS